MHVARTLDCSGLSNAPTVLRIKQALAGATDRDEPIGVLLGENCDCDRIAGSLGSAADQVHLITPTRQ